MTPQLSEILSYTDKDGRLTVEGLKLLRQVLAMLRDHEARIEALEP